jgi:hypothetical protein
MATPAQRSGRFLVLDNVELHKSSSRVTCIVKLQRSGESFRGEASELDTNSGRLRAAARATLAAAAQAVDTVSFGLEGAACVELFSRRYIVVSIEAAHRRQFILLSGIIASESARFPEEAAALATLRAIDRWIALP